MSPVIIAVLILLALVMAIAIGHQLRRLLPDRRVNEDTRDTVKLAIGLIGTMSALLLGLLVSSAKGAYDAQRTQVTQMAAKVAVLNRILALYGPEAMDVRKAFRVAIEDAIRRLWPNDKSLPASLTPNTEAGDSVYFKIEMLAPTNDQQQKLKVLAETTAVELAQQRALLLAQSESSISTPLLVMVVSWLLVIFASFSLLAPPNAAANIALLISSLAVAGAIFLLLELDQPFGGLITIPSKEMVNALNQLPQ
jgi:hypothetical protein